MSEQNETKRSYSPVNSALNAVRLLPNRLVGYVGHDNRTSLHMALFYADQEYMAQNPDHVNEGSHYSPATARIRGAIEAYAQAAATGTHLESAEQELRAAFAARIQYEHTEALTETKQDKAFEDAEYAKALEAFDVTIGAIKTTIHDSLASSKQAGQASGRSRE